MWTQTRSYYYVFYISFRKQFCWSKLAVLQSLCTKVHSIKCVYIHIPQFKHKFYEHFIIQIKSIHRYVLVHIHALIWVGLVRICAFTLTLAQSIQNLKSVSISYATFSLFCITRFLLVIYNWYPFWFMISEKYFPQKILHYLLYTLQFCSSLSTS